MNLIFLKKNLTRFSAIVYITSEFIFVKKWIQKLNSYFADFEQVKNVGYFAEFEQDKKMLVILLTLGYWHKNVIS